MQWSTINIFFATLIDMSFFERVQIAPPDPILGLAQAFLADQRSCKVNLGVGSYRTEALAPFILSSVKEAESRLLSEEKNKEYLPIEGDNAYLALSHQLVFGSPLSEEVVACQTVGGTGALRLGGQFLVNTGLKKIYIPTPTWGNHHRIFTHAGMDIEEIPYYDSINNKFAFDKFMQALKTMPEGSLILLHGSCHNPTGIDPTLEEWQKILQKIKERRLFPIFDVAYQGFGEGIEKDVTALRLFKDNNIEMAVTVSYSKNFGLYGERVGVLFFICKEKAQKESVLSQIKVLIRGNYSNPPCHGAKIVKEILQNESLRLIWLKELEMMRIRIASIRQAFADALEAKHVSIEFGHIKKARGMFAFTGLRSEEVRKLIEEYGIYMSSDGRISLAGLNNENMPYVVEAIMSMYARR